MSNSEAKIKIKLGQIEIEYQGDAGYLRNGFLDAVKEIVDLQQNVPTLVQTYDSQASSNMEQNASSELNYSTDSIATILGAKSGTDLVFAAVSHLCVIKKKVNAAHAEILEEMKAAENHYTKSFGKNIKASLSRLTKGGRLRLVSSGVYSLTLKEKQMVEEALANAE